jgi:arsenite methyltransferase
MSNHHEDALRDEIRDRCRAGALAAGDGCGATTACGPEEADRFGAGLYDEGEQTQLPDAALKASCGNAVAVAELHPGEVVLDLGSGGGIDVLLSARRVGPTGKAST